MPKAPLPLFAVLGVSLFRGKYYGCTDELVQDPRPYENLTTAETLLAWRAACTGNGTHYRSGLPIVREWVNSPSNFDDIFSAMLTLFEVMSLDNWRVVANQGVASTRDAAFIYFIGFILGEAARIPY